METHLKAVGLIEVITGAFFTGLAVLVSLGVLLFAPWFNGAPVWSPEDAAWVVVIVLGVSGLLFAFGIPSLVAGIGVLKQKPWARTASLIAALLLTTVFPAGTVAGLYTLWVLSQKETDGLLVATS